MVEYKLTPTIVSLQQLRLWQRQAIAHGRQLPTGLHIDSGMHRTGLPVKESAQLAREHSRLTGLLVSHVISHLASADDCHSPQSEQHGRHAIVAAGYADGVLRSTSNTGQVAIDGRRCPIIGRVSMDLTIIDVTGIPQHLLYPGAAVELIGPTITVDDAARAADTISYEMLTSIGKRYRRRYTGKQTGH